MPGQIPEEVVEEIRKANDIVDVVGEYVQLKKQGRNFFGLCPFHNEKSPSFSVTQDKQIYHCFGCGKGGNAITFVMDIEGYTFQQAVALLAEKAGRTLPELHASEGNGERDNKDKQDSLQAYEWLSKLYHHLLRHTKEGKEAYQYLLDRGFSEDTIDEFQLGFAPNSRSFTSEFLEKKGFHPQMMVKAGILTATESKQTVDRFRGRVMFPIRNHLGKCIAFGGRAMHNQEPKYLNSPETELFRKGTLLYNFDKARSHIRKQGEAVIFEGYADTIAAYQAGIKNGVATLGTSITDTQARLLKRYVDTVTICYDADQAGIEASYKAATILKKNGCQVKVADLPDGMDPDDYISRYGPDKFKREIIQPSDTYMTFIFRYKKRNFNLSLEGDRIQYVESVLDEIAVMDKPVEREYYLKELASEFDLSMQTLVQEVSNRRSDKGLDERRGRKRYQNWKAEEPIQQKKLLPAFHNAERQLIAYMLKNPSIAEKVKEEVAASFNIEAHQIIVTHLYGYYEDGHPADISQFVEKLPDPDLQNLVIQISMIPVYEEISDKEIRDYIHLILTEQSDKPSIKALEEEQRQAEKQNDHLKAARIAMKIVEIKRQAKNPNH